MEFQYFWVTYKFYTSLILHSHHDKTLFNAGTDSFLTVFESEHVAIEPFLRKIDKVPELNKLFSEEGFKLEQSVWIKEISMELLLSFDGYELAAVAALQVLE